MPVINLSIKALPNVPNGDSYPVIDSVIDLIRSSGVKYIVGPSETTMEGEMDLLFDIAKRAHELCIEKGAQRVCMVMNTDYRPEGITMDEKVSKFQE